MGETHGTRNHEPPQPQSGDSTSYVASPGVSDRLSKGGLAVAASRLEIMRAVGSVGSAHGDMLSPLRG